MPDPIYNPYSVKRIAGGAAFVGREEGIRQIVTSTDDAVAFAYTRFGKTSFQRVVEGKLKEKGKDVLYVPNCGRSEEALRRAIMLQGRKESDILGPVKSSSDLREAVYALDDAYEGRRLYLLLDETEFLFLQENGTANEDTIAFFKELNTSLENITLVYAIFPHVYSRMQIGGSRFGDTAETIRLPPFGKAQTGELVGLCTDPDKMRTVCDRENHGDFVFDAFRVQEDVATRVYEITGGHPFLIQCLMKELIDYSLEEGSLELTGEKVEKLYEKYCRIAQEQIGHVWRGIGQDRTQAQIIELIAQNPGISRDDLAERVETKNPSQFNGALSSIDDLGMGIVTDQKGHRIRGEVMADAIDFFIKHLRK